MTQWRVNSLITVGTSLVRLALLPECSWCVMTRGRRCAAQNPRRSRCRTCTHPLESRPQIPLDACAFWKLFWNAELAYKPWHAAWSSVRLVFMTVGSQNRTWRWNPGPNDRPKSYQRRWSHLNLSCLTHDATFPALTTKAINHISLCDTPACFVRRLIPQSLRLSLRNPGISPGGAVCGSHPPSLPHPRFCLLIPLIFYSLCCLRSYISVVEPFHGVFFFSLHLCVAQYPVWIIKPIFSVQVAACSVVSC